MTLISVILAFVLMFAMASHPQVLSQQEEEVKKLEGERSKAQVQGDIGKLDEMLAPEFMELNTAGQIRTKRENIEGHKSGQVHWEKFDLDELSVRVYGETAVVSGRLTPYERYRAAHKRLGSLPLGGNRRGLLAPRNSRR